MAGEREEARQRVGVKRRELIRRHPAQERLCRILILAGGIEPHGNIHVVGDVALVACLGDGRCERRHLQVLVRLEAGDRPRSSRIDCSLAGLEEGGRVRVGLRFKAVGEIGLPLRQFLERGDPIGIGQLFLAGDQRLAAILALPVVRADVLVAHGRCFPLVVGTDIERDIGAVGLDLVEIGIELVHRLGRRGDADFGEGVRVVDEAMQHRGHRHAEGLFAVVSRPGNLGGRGEVFHAGEARHIGELTCLEQGKGGIERPAGDDVTGTAALQLGVERGVVLGRIRRREHDLDIGVRFHEHRQDLVLPDRQIVAAPALDGQRGVRIGQTRRSQERRGQQQSCNHSFRHD